MCLHCLRSRCLGSDCCSGRERDRRHRLLTSSIRGLDRFKLHPTLALFVRGGIERQRSLVPGIEIRSLPELLQLLIRFAQAVGHLLLLVQLLHGGLLQALRFPDRSCEIYGILLVLNHCIVLLHHTPRQHLLSLLRVACFLTRPVCGLVRLVGDRLKLARISVQPIRLQQERVRVCVKCGVLNHHISNLLIERVDCSLVRLHLIVDHRGDFSSLVGRKVSLPTLVLRAFSDRLAGFCPTPGRLASDFSLRIELGEYEVLLGSQDLRGFHELDPGCFLALQLELLVKGLLRHASSLFPNALGLLCHLS